MRLIGDAPTTEVRHHMNWGAIHPDDARVRLTFTSERGARDYVRCTPDARLVRAAVTVTVTTTFGDWELEVPVTT